MPIGLTNILTPTDVNAWMVDILPDKIYVGSFKGTSNFSKIDFQQLSYFQNVLTDVQSNNHNNRNRPKNPQTEFGSNCLFFLNADDSGSTAQFTITDAISSVTLVSSNLEDVDKTTITTH